MYNNSANTKFTGKSILFLPSCHSTNSIALDKIRSGEATNGLIVITDEQTSGRGQRGNVWLSKPGANLTLSIIYLPEVFPVQDGFYLNMVASLAVSETLQTLLPQKSVSVKWPNDVYCGVKKLSGILIENAIRGNYISSSIIGIGINVNENITQLPNAGSLYQEINHILNLQDIFTILIENIERYYLLLMSGQKTELFKQYTQQLFRLNQQCMYKDAEGEFTGTIKGITADGKLVMQRNSGETLFYNFKEVEYIHEHTLP